jgi:hypothetical protein
LRLERGPMKKPRHWPGLLNILTQGGDQYFATTGPVQLKR